MKYGLLTVLCFFHITLFAQSNDQVEPKSYSPDAQYVDSLVQKAHTMQLHNDPYWRLLLHYKTGLFGGRSLIDDPGFFLSPNGKRNAAKEMEASIRAFFSETSGSYENETRHPALKFIARYSWLSQKLDIDVSKMPFNPIEKFEEYYVGLKIERALLVFSSGYMGSPASMFGHTFLILEPKDTNRLLALAVNYAADSQESFGPMFAIRGLFGLYDGMYSFLAYYNKINEYVNSEMRNMWEYKLNFSDIEMRRMLMHLIELEGIKSDYFFISENCSYNLLFLLEVARPTAELTDRFIYATEPVGTLHAALDAGLVEKRDYRPSLYSKIMYRAEILDPENEEKAIALAKGKDMKIVYSSEEEEAKTLDLASDYLQFLLVKGELTQEDYAKRLVALLQRRSELQYRDSIANDITVPSPPESSHGSSQIALGGGVFDNKGFIEFKYRLNCHELMDEDEGFSSDSEFAFGNVFLRYYPESNRLDLQRFDVFSVIAFPSVNKYYTETCWQVRMGAEQAISPDLNNTLSGYMRSGIGYSFPLSWAGRLYIMADLNVNVSSKFDYYSFTAIGGTAGIITPYKYSFKNHIFFRSDWSLWGNTTWDWEAGLEQMYSPVKDFAIFIKCSRRGVFGATFDELQARAAYYF